MLDSLQLTLVESLDDLINLRTWLAQDRQLLGVDTETGGLEWYRQPLRTVQLGDMTHGWCVPWNEWQGAVKELLGRYNRATAWQNRKFDAHFLLRHGCPDPGDIKHDARFQSYLMEPNKRTALKVVATREVDPRAAYGQNLLKEVMARNGWGWDTVPVDHPWYWAYAALDTSLTVAVAEKLLPQVISAGLGAAYDLEMACQETIFKAETVGFQLDLDYVTRKRAEWQLEIEMIKTGDAAEAFEGDTFKATRVIERLQRDGVVLTKRTPTGNWSLDEEALEGITHPLALAVRRVKKLQKLVSTYLGGFLEMNDNGVVHPDVNLLAAKTGRMSAGIFQTMPRGKAIRSCIIARPGHKLVLMDYRQQEMRVFAHYARDPAFTALFEGDADPYYGLGQLIFNSEVITKEQRRMGKVGQLSKLYGAGAWRFADTMGIAEDFARQIYAALDSRFPGSKAFQRRVIDEVERRGREDGEAWLTTWGGRRLVVPTDLAYKAIDYLCQGSCADVTKRSLVEMDCAGLDEYIRLPVHDEIVLEVPDEDVPDVIHSGREIMTRTEFDPHLTVEVKVVECWGDAYDDE